MCEQHLFITGKYIYQGGALYLYLILSETFQMTTDVVTDLKTTFTTFKERGLYKTRVENVSLISNQLEYVAVSLNEVQSLPRNVHVRVKP